MALDFLLDGDVDPNRRLVEYVEHPDQCFASEDEMSDLLHNERKQVFGLDALRLHGRMTAGSHHALREPFKLLDRNPRFALALIVSLELVPEMHHRFLVDHCFGAFHVENIGGEQEPQGCLDEETADAEVHTVQFVIGEKVVGDAQRWFEQRVPLARSRFLAHPPEEDVHRRFRSQIFELPDVLQQVVGFQAVGLEQVEARVRTNQNSSSCSTLSLVVLQEQ